MSEAKLSATQSQELGEVDNGRRDPEPVERRALLDELRLKGVRMTAQRRAIVEVIQDATEHLDAAALLRLAKERDTNVDRATVYRTIDLLKRLRLIDELDLTHLHGEKHFYEAKSRRDHLHLACFRCGRVEEFASVSFERIKQEIADQTGFSARVTRLEVGGTCRACAAAEAAESAPPEEPEIATAKPASE